MALIEPPPRAKATPGRAGPLPLGGIGQPVAFAGQAGVWHAAAGDVAVVLCPPVGREARCAYLPLRRFAERLAQEGYPTLRFDYPGEGESADGPDHEHDDAFARWLSGVRAAVAYAREASGVRRVVLAGLRLGGSLAALAAQDQAGEPNGIDGLMLLAPIPSGRGWVRELKLAAAMGAAAFRDPDERGLVSDDLRLSPATVTALQALNLSALSGTAPRVLLRAQAPAIAALAEPLRARGAEVAVGDFPGYDALFEEPHSNMAPHALFGEAIAWLQATLPTAPATQAGDVAPRCLSGAGWRERPVSFGAGLVGVVCEPEAPDAPSPGTAVIFLSTGGDPRAGLGRFPVTAARLLALDGRTSLRFDFAGVGDSPAAEGERSHVFETPRQADIAAAVALMRAEGFEGTALVGICAGAFHAVRAADQPGVAAIYAVSTQKFVWRRGDSLALGRRDDAGATRTYVAGVRSVRTWARLLRGEVQVGRILRALAGRFAASLAAPANPEGARVRRLLADFSARGGRARFLLGINDAALDEMQRWFGRGGRRIAAMPGASVRIAPRLDHGLSYAESRAIALEDLRAFLRTVA